MRLNYFSSARKKYFFIDVWKHLGSRMLSEASKYIVIVSPYIKNLLISQSRKSDASIVLLSKSGRGKVYVAYIGSSLCRIQAPMEERSCRTMGKKNHTMHQAIESNRCFTRHTTISETHKQSINAGIFCTGGSIIFIV